MVGGLVGGGLVAWRASDNSTEAPGTPVVTQPISVELSSAVSEAAEKVRPAVVRIESTRRTTGGIEQDVGSGVIIDTEGHVVTNAHVVLETETLKVILSDGTERPAILVGHDFPFSDVAVLQIGPGKLTPAEVGDSSKLHLGEAVVAIGNPLAEFDGSVSVGVISGLDRVRALDGVKQTDFLQTDAAINSGNSGGALINLDGQFIGMPTAVIRQSRAGVAVEGIAFAIPSEHVMRIANEIIRIGGSYPRPSIDADHIDLSADVIPRVTRLSVREGAFIAAVTPGGAADQAGIQAGDVIMQVGDTVINEDTPFLNALMEYNHGDTAKVVLNRNGRIIEVEVRFAQRS
ncbi:MAG: S1C family serine protease [Dehalococcoidia bacterium]